MKLGKKLVSLLLAVLMLVSTVSAMQFIALAADLPAYSAALVSGDAATAPVVTVTQEKKNYLDAIIKVDNVDALVAAGVTKATVKAEMSYNGAVTQSKAGEIALQAGTKEYKFTYPAYGKFTTTLDFGGKYSLKAENGIVAEHYNIAGLNGTFPVLYFSLSLEQMTVNESGEPVPTVIFLERNDAYNWDKLPANAYQLPYATAAQLADGRQYFHTLRDIMAAYVKDLYALDNTAKFTLWTVDNYADSILMYMTANGIPEAQYDVKLLSDGSGSYARFNEVYNVDGRKASETYAEMAAEWAKIKADVKAKGKFDPAIVTKYAGPVAPYEVLTHYAWVITNEESNVEWWLNRVRKNQTVYAKDDNDTFIDGVVASTKIKQNNMNNMLKAMKDPALFKALYKFNDEMFAEAEKQNKKVMMLLGSLASDNGKYEPDFEDYANFVKDYYGDEYIYYYKGHPGTPTVLYPEKQAQLDKLGYIDVDSSIAAEIILYFYPGLYMCGYASSTYDSVEKNEMACALFNYTKAAAEADTNVSKYSQRMDSFVSKIKKDDAYYKDYLTYCANEADTYYLVEYNDTAKYDFSIYDATKRELVNYKRNAAVAIYRYSIVVDGTETVKGEASSVALPKAPEKAGYVFKGWSDGKVLYPAEASVELTGTTTFTAVFETATIKSAKLSKTAYTYSGKVKKPAVTVTDSEDQVLTEGKDYALVYSNASSKNVGAYTVTVVYKGDYSSVPTKTLKYTIGPKKTVAIKSLTTKSKALTVKWGKVAAANGYQVQIATDKAFTKNKKTYTIKKNATLTKTISKLTKGKKYYVRVRAYKTVDGKKCYAAWSKVKKIKIK